MVICLEQGADLHMAQLMPLPLTVSCFSKIQIGFTFLVPASPRQRAVKRVCVSHISHLFCFSVFSCRINLFGIYVIMFVTVLMSVLKVSCVQTLCVQLFVIK